jgi:hypothetical protein
MTSRSYSSWSARSLREACRERLTMQLNVPLLGMALAELKSDESESPEKIMNKIDDILRRADSSVSESRLKQMRYQKFTELLSKYHKAMYFYVESKMEDRPQRVTDSGNFEDQDAEAEEAMKYAKQYLKKKGYETRFMQEYVQDQFKQRGLPNTTEDTSGKIFPGMEVKRYRKPSDDTNITARFLSKEKQATNEDIVVRLNEYERFMRRMKKTRAYREEAGSDDRGRSRDRDRRQFQRRSSSAEGMDRARRPSVDYRKKEERSGDKPRWDKKK